MTCIRSDLWRGTPAIYGKQCCCALEVRLTCARLLLERQVTTRLGLYRHFGDLAFNAGQIVACTINGPDVAVWLVDSPCTSDGGVSVQTTAADNQTIAGENGSSIISADSSANHTGRNPAQQCNAEVSVARAEGSASAAGKSKLHTGTTDSLRTKTAVRERGSSPHAAQSTPIDLGAQIRSGHTWLCQAMAQRLATIQVAYYLSASAVSRTPAI
eukprot:COSAG01_NODE_8351_length_2819_cov_179.568750_3_plen_214_part_00